MDIATKRVPWYNIGLALAFIGGMAFISLKYAPQITDVLRSTDTFRDFILSYGNRGVLVLMGFQLVQILIPVIPGEVVQIAGGYLYGTLVGSIYLVIATIIGTIIVFFAARCIGYPIVRIFVKTATLEKYKSRLNSHKAETIIFIMMLIPGFPKDLLTYMAGLAPIRSIRFIIISMVARTPGLIGSAFIGSSIQHQDYTTVIIMSIITGVILATAYFFRQSKFFKSVPR